jgi:GrpB-like predicted nucleotidyltransferase (UPF0157 family)
MIEEYDPQWPLRFEELRARILAALGGLASAIEHVGSTAVPGLAAKPIVDMDVLLKSSSDFPDAVSRLSALGYCHQGDLGITGREAFRAPLADFAHHLYVCLPEFPQYRRHIAFRDHLRNHPQDAMAYAALKRQLAARFSLDREAYVLGKTQFVSAILERASSRES